MPKQPHTEKRLKLYSNTGLLVSCGLLDSYLALPNLSLLFVIHFSSRQGSQTEQSIHYQHLQGYSHGCGWVSPQRLHVLSSSNWNPEPMKFLIADLVICLHETDMGNAAGTGTLAIDMEDCSTLNYRHPLMSRTGWRNSGSSGSSCPTAVHPRQKIVNRTLSK